MSEDINTKKSKKELPAVHEVTENASPSGKSIGRVVNYQQYRSGFVCNHTVDGFWFDQDQFENLIDMWAPQEDIIAILDTSREDLDIFCKALYGQNFDHVYRKLLAISRTLMRNAISGLAKQGNSTALATATKHFAKLDDDNGSKPISIVIKNDLD